MSTINGANQKTVEDLLFSIRSSIVEDTEAFGQDARAQAAAHGNVTPRERGFSDDSAEFELPAIFKPGHQQQIEKSNNLFGRLSEALKPTASSESDRSRTVVRFEPVGGRMIEPPKARGAEPKDDVIDQVNRVARENATLKREMPTFFDTRMRGLGESAQKAAQQAAQPAPAPEVTVAAQQPPPLRHPMQTSAAEVQGSGALPPGGFEDAAAQLLKPILKQWLTENMPKIVEKALRNETGGDFPSAGKP